MRPEEIACVDFDATIKPWVDDLFDLNVPPLPGAAEAVLALRDAGYRIIILTSRLSRIWLHSIAGDEWANEGLKHLHHVQDYLNRHGIPWDLVTAEKLPAAAYFDDRAVHVDPIHDLKAQVDSFLRERWQAA